MPSFLHIILPDCFIPVFISFPNSLHVDVTAQTPSNSLHSSHSASRFQMFLWWGRHMHPAMHVMPNSFKSSCLLFPSYLVLDSRESSSDLKSWLHLPIIHLLTSNSWFSPLQQPLKMRVWVPSVTSCKRSTGVPYFSSWMFMRCRHPPAQLQMCPSLWEVLPLTLPLNADRISSVGT